jgi:Lipase (class 3)
MDDIPYSPRKVDLFEPARAGKFFAAGLPQSEAAICAEMARLAYCRCEPDFQFDRRQIEAILKPLGFACQFFESKSTPEGRGVHGFVTFRDDRDLNRRLAVVAFRGTDASDPTDLADDAEFLQVKWPAGGVVHRGFAEALEQVRPGIEAALKPLSGRVLFTGHSLGAAMATLLASIRRPDLLCTIGSPRVGDAEFVATLQGVNSRRFVNCCDVVARIPPESFGEIKYQHFGPTSYIWRNRRITENPDSEAVEKDRLEAAAAYLAEYAWRCGNVAVRELADHAAINYGTAIAADTKGATE